jgi:hypothetical protein
MFLFYWINYKCPIKSRMSNSQRTKIKPGGAATPPIRIPISNQKYGNLMMVQPGMAQHILVQPGMAQHILVQPGMAPHMMIQPRMAPHMMVQPGMAPHMMVQPGTGQYIIGPSHGFVVGRGF